MSLPSQQGLKLPFLMAIDKVLTDEKRDASPLSKASSICSLHSNITNSAQSKKRSLNEESDENCCNAIAAGVSNAHHHDNESKLTVNDSSSEASFNSHDMNKRFKSSNNKLPFSATQQQQQILPSTATHPAYDQNPLNLLSSVSESVIPSIHSDNSNNNTKVNNNSDFIKSIVEHASHHPMISQVQLQQKMAEITASLAEKLPKTQDLHSNGIKYELEDKFNQFKVVQEQLLSMKHAAASATANNDNRKDGRSYVTNGNIHHESKVEKEDDSDETEDESDDMDEDDDDMDDDDDGSVGSSDSKSAKLIDKDPWRPEEDLILINEQSKIGNRWLLISHLLPNRTKAQCKVRYTSIYRASRKEWTLENDILILQLFQKLKGDFKKMSLAFANRTSNSVKLRYRELRRIRKARGTFAPPIAGSPRQIFYANRLLLSEYFLHSGSHDVYVPRGSLNLPNTPAMTMNESLQYMDISQHSPLPLPDSFDAIREMIEQRKKELPVKKRKGIPKTSDLLGSLRREPKEQTNLQVLLPNKDSQQQLQGSHQQQQQSVEHELPKIKPKKKVKEMSKPLSPKESVARETAKPTPISIKEQMPFAPNYPFAAPAQIPFKLPYPFPGQLAGMQPFSPEMAAAANPYFYPPFCTAMQLPTFAPFLQPRMVFPPPHQTADSMHSQFYKSREAEITNNNLPGNSS